jgi:hypothetical protein
MRVGSRLSMGDSALSILIAKMLGTNRIQQDKISALLTQRFPFNSNRKAAKVLQSHQVNQSLPRGTKQGAMTPVRAVGNANGARLAQDEITGGKPKKTPAERTASNLDSLELAQEQFGEAGDENPDYLERVTQKLARAQKRSYKARQGARLATENNSEASLAQTRRIVLAQYAERQRLLEKLRHTRNPQQRDELIKQITANYGEIDKSDRLEDPRKSNNINGARLSIKAHELSEYLTNHGIAMDATTNGDNYVTFSFDRSYKRENFDNEALTPPADLIEVFGLELSSRLEDSEISYRVANPDNFEELKQVAKEVKEALPIGARLSIVEI